MRPSSVLQCKVVLLGDSGVGKSSLLYRYVQNTFSVERDPTMGASFMSKQINVGPKAVKFNIWDTAGQERYHSLAKMYYRDAIVAILVYDLTQTNSYQSLQRWVTELKTEASPTILIAVAANKDDLTRELDTEAQSWADSIHAIYRRTSAKIGTGVEQLFEDIANRLGKEYGALIVNAQRRKSAVLVKEPLIDIPQQKKRSCCAGKKKKAKN